MFSLGWSLWWPFALSGELLWSSVSPVVSDCGREGPLCAVFGVAGLPLWFAASMQVCCWDSCSFPPCRLGCCGELWLPWLLLGVLAGSMCGVVSCALVVGYLLSSAPVGALTWWGQSGCYERNVGPGWCIRRVLLVQLCWVLGST